MGFMLLLQSATSADWYRQWMQMDNLSNGKRLHIYICRIREQLNTLLLYMPSWLFAQDGGAEINFINAVGSSAWCCSIHWDSSPAQDGGTWNSAGNRQPKNCDNPMISTQVLRSKTGRWGGAGRYIPTLSLSFSNNSFRFNELTRMVKFIRSDYIVGLKRSQKYDLLCLGILEVELISLQISLKSCRQDLLANHISLCRQRRIQKEKSWRRPTIASIA